MPLFSKKKKKKKKAYFERKRVSTHEWNRGRERGKKGIPSRLHAANAEPDAGLELANRAIMT